MLRTVASACLGISARSVVGLSGHFVAARGKCTNARSVGQTRILVTGCLGQIGQALVPLLRTKYGAEHVIATDIHMPPSSAYNDGPFFHLDVTDAKRIQQLVVEERIDWIVHNATILSSMGEEIPNVAHNVNVGGAKNVLEVAKDYKLRVLSPSSIAVFGPDTPKDNTPDVTIANPNTMYGITKSHIELLGTYYYTKFGVDFRSLRYPGIISTDDLVGGGTTDYAVEIFVAAVKEGKYKCWLSEDTTLPMMYMADCLRATLLFLEAPNKCLTQRVYNVGAISFSPKELALEVKKEMPHFIMEYDAGDKRQQIARGWPRSVDDSRARRDWGWYHEYDIEKLTKEMITEMRKKCAGK